MLPPARSISAGHPVAPGNALFPLPLLLSPEKETIFDSPCPDGSALHGTSQQRNTHSIESREVRYTWHPWCGRLVAVHQTFAKNGQVVSHCSIEEHSEARHLEIPEWMFDPAKCRGMRLAAVPTVSCEALLDRPSKDRRRKVPQKFRVLCDNFWEL
jgi:hypothetical protein